MYRERNILIINIFFKKDTAIRMTRTTDTQKLPHSRNDSSHVFSLVSSFTEISSLLYLVMV